MGIAWGGNSASEPLDVLMRLKALQLQDSNRMFQENMSAQHARDSNAQHDQGQQIALQHYADQLAQRQAEQVAQEHHQQAALDQQKQWRNDALNQNTVQFKEAEQRRRDQLAQQADQKEADRQLREQLAGQAVADKAERAKQAEIANRVHSMTRSAEFVGRDDLLPRIPDEAKGIMPPPHQGGGAFTQKMNFPTPTVEQEIAKTRGARYQEMKDLKNKSLNQRQDNFDANMEYKTGKDAANATYRDQKDAARTAEKEKPDQNLIQYVETSVSREAPEDQPAAFEARMSELTGKLPQNWKNNRFLAQDIASYDEQQQQMAAKNLMYTPKPGPVAWQQAHHPQNADALKRNAGAYNALVEKYSGGNKPNKGNPPAEPMPNKPTQISNDDEFNALPSGTEFIDPKGVKRRKP